MNMNSDILIITLDGNIGAGKSTFLKELEKELPYIDIVLEPVDVWESLVSEDGKSLLVKFYEDPKRWGYTFQNCAILTRILEVKKKIKTTTKKVIVTERSVLTDLNVFAKINRDLGNINKLEWDLYMKWADGYAVDVPVDAAIHITTSVDTSIKRIENRARNGEQQIPRDYLEKLHEYHHLWLDNTDLPVLNISTETNESIKSNVHKVDNFIKSMMSMSKQ